MEFEFLIDHIFHKVSVDKTGNALLFKEAGATFEADIRPISENVLSIIIEGRSYSAYIVRDKDKKIVFLNGRSTIVEKPGEGAKAFHGGEERTREGQLRITAPMPGRVIKINVAEGEKVRKNQTLAIVEAMKMENEIKASCEAVVKKIHTSTGELVDAEKLLIELELEK